MEWGRLANELHELGVLTRLDRAVLAGYCQAWADWVEAEQQLQKFGKVIRTATRTTVRRGKDGTEVTENTGGNVVQSPFLAIRNKSLELMMKFAAEMGLSASSRSRVTRSEAAKPADPAAKYF